MLYNEDTKVNRHELRAATRPARHTHITKATNIASIIAIIIADLKSIFNINLYYVFDLAVCICLINWIVFVHIEQKWNAIKCIWKVCVCACTLCDWHAKCDESMILTDENAVIFFHAVLNSCLIVSCFSFSCSIKIIIVGDNYMSRCTFLRRIFFFLQHIQSATATISYPLSFCRTHSVHRIQS